jgi:hypothetical protein
MSGILSRHALRVNRSEDARDRELTIIVRVHIITKIISEYPRRNPETTHWIKLRQGPHARVRG